MRRNRLEKCPKHPKYRGKRKPTSNCKMCQNIYVWKRVGYTIDIPTKEDLKRRQDIKDRLFEMVCANLHSDIDMPSVCVKSFLQRCHEIVTGNVE